MVDDKEPITLPCSSQMFDWILNLAKDEKAANEEIMEYRIFSRQAKQSALIVFLSKKYCAEPDYCTQISYLGHRIKLRTVHATCSLFIFVQMPHNSGR